MVGLAFLLFLAGLEVELDRFKGPFLRMTLVALGASALLGLVAGFSLNALGLVESPLLVGIILLATSLGLIIPVLKDAGETASSFGQLVIAGGALADFSAVILLSLLFSREPTGTGAQVVLLTSFGLLVVAGGFAIARAGRSTLISGALRRLQDTTAQIRVRGAVLLLVGVVAVADHLGLEVILGAFLAGALLKILDRDEAMTHPQFRVKLEAIGFGFFVPIFFVTSGLTFDLGALFGSITAILRIPVFLALLLVVRGLPALLYRPAIGPERAIAAAFLQATSLPFIVAATQIGMELGALGRATGAALVAAGLLSVLLFPLGALTALRSESLAARSG